MSSSDPDGPFFLPLRGGAGQARAAEAPGRTVRGMGTLILTRAGKSRDGERNTGKGQTKTTPPAAWPKRRCPSCKKRLQAAQSLEKQIAHKQSLR
ncbi:MAG: hypothetical protein WA693_13505 [Pseudolabrys sp.]